MNIHYCVYNSLPTGSLSQVNPVHAHPHTPHHTLNYFLKLQFSIILLIQLVLLSGLFPWGFPTKTLYKPLLSPPPNKPCVMAIFFSLILSPEYFVTSIDYESLHHAFSPVCCYPLPLKPKYFPQHPTLKLLQSLIPQCDRPTLKSQRMSQKTVNSIVQNW